MGRGKANIERYIERKGSALRVGNGEHGIYKERNLHRFLSGWQSKEGDTVGFAGD